MRSFRWLVALVLLVLGRVPAHGQLVITTVSPPAFGYGYGYGISGSSFGLGVRFGRHGGLSLSSVGVAYGPYFAPGYSRTTVVYGGPVVYAVPVVVGPPDILGFDAMPDDRDRQPNPRRAPFDGERRAPAPPPKPKPEPPPPPPQKPEPKPAPKPEPPAPPPPPLPKPPAPEKDPVDENARLVAQGRQAFADREYGKASQRFRQAVRVAPQLPRAHFLLAEALFALGKYHDAVEAILAGMAVRPDWPASGFRPLELYGANVADYPEHLQRLEQATRANPADPVLLFLSGYQLWFDGRREEARLLFRRALPGAVDPEVIQRFLRALPPAPVL